MNAARSSSTSQILRPSKRRGEGMRFSLTSVRNLLADTPIAAAASTSPSPNTTDKNVMSECTLVRLIVYTLMIPFAPLPRISKKLERIGAFALVVAVPESFLVGEISIMQHFLAIISFRFADCPPAWLHAPERGRTIRILEATSTILDNPKIVSQQTYLRYKAAAP